MGQEFLSRMGKIGLLNGVLFGVLSFGCIYFGFYLRWMFFVLCVFEIFSLWEVPPGLLLSKGKARMAQYTGFAVAAIPFGLVTFNVFGVVGYKQLAVAATVAVVVGGLVWLTAAAPLDH